MFDWVLNTPLMFLETSTDLFVQHTTERNYGV